MFFFICTDLASALSVFAFTYQPDYAKKGESSLAYFLFDIIDKA
jgi:hypothetical protein